MEDDEWNDINFRAKATIILFWRHCQGELLLVFLY